ncbi:copper-translocating P-type ATPase [Actinocorallia sp. API 0066]|uniref:copper-translocating P-type ATPase n=1 Tax=Actinocorallia sp. API 0066 TaxID=2896846 RepID=UPI001E627515|nr:copper-translocating P-type ATPase [Actinocorallia sp. API 0066]MCD0447994.1 copper-translocating P-type ATPase [Actinocorallia sp. API 0066]
MTHGTPPNPDEAGHGAHGAHGGHDAHAGHDPEVFRRRFWWSVLLSVPLVLVSELFQEWLGYRVDFPGSWLIGPVFGSAVFFYGGWPFLVGAAREVRDRAPGMMLLISMAVVVAYAASLASSVGWFHMDFWWELGTLIAVMLLGHWQEMKAVGQAHGALSALAALLPDEAEVVGADGGLEAVPASSVRLGDTVLVRPGGRVPTDGEVTQGAAEMDESMITGESRPVARGVGEKVVAGTVATDSALRVRVTAVGEDTALAGIARLVARAQASRGRAQVLADRFAAALFYVALSTAVVTFVVWTVIGNIEEAVTRTVTVLVIACPHALGLAIPLVVALSTAVAAKAGILIKDRLALERMRTVDTVLFDKTGTLTKGEHAVTGVVTDGVPEARARALAAGVESESEHPLARALVRASDSPASATGFRALPGKGVTAEIDGTPYAVGGPGLLKDTGAGVPERLRPETERWSAEGAAVLYLVREGAEPKAEAAFALRDEVRPEAREAVRGLRDEGVRTIGMITGDAWPVARSVAAELGVDEVFAEVVPADKDGKVAELQERGHKVAMVGDGVNDAPALARADVGLAIGAGTDVAIESAGVVLASSDPRSVTSVIRLSRATYRKMIQNLAWAAGYNIVTLPLAAGVLAWAGVSLGPAVGALLMSASTIVVALNAQLLRRVDLRPR